MSLYGVRYQNLDATKLDFILPIRQGRDAAIAHSLDADCPTWVVPIDRDPTGQIIQIDLPIAHHPGRRIVSAPAATRPAPPSPRQQRWREEHGDDERAPTEETVTALIRLHQHGERPADARTRAALHRRGWSDVDARFITPPGLVAAAGFDRARAAKLVGASS